MSTESGVIAAVAARVGGDVLAVDAGFGPPTVDVARTSWAAALAAAAAAGATYLDFLTAYDDVDACWVVAHLATPDAGDHVLLRTSVPHDDLAVATATTVYRGAAWHERETHEMYGIRFDGHAPLEPLLLPPDSIATPLRKHVLLAARLAVAWPGDKDPSDSEGRPRRRVPPPGVPADHVPPGASP